jgi:hypothetical protein
LRRLILSSTNRTNAKERHVSDYYITPHWCIDDFLKAWIPDIDDPNDFIGIKTQAERLLILDPCAGGDALNEMSYPTVLKKRLLLAEPAVIDTIDIREDSRADKKGDFLTMNDLPDYDIVITNPPFNIALDVIKKALSITQPMGFVVMLLRLNFLGSKQRKPFWEETMPERIYVHSKRMSFTDTTQTDSIEYAHFVWRKGFYPDYAKIKII